MYERAALLGLYAETPLHPGTGQAVGAVDLPVQRERHTGYPLIPGSSLKGVFRAAAEHVLDSDRVAVIFGPGNAQAAAHAGALGLTDARLLLFPVRALFGVFAWITCPFVLERFRRDAALAGLALDTPPDVPSGTALVAAQSAVTQDNTVVLEEFTFAAQRKPEVNALAEALARYILPSLSSLPEYAPWHARLPRQLVILANDDFGDFVHFATEVVARIALDDETGTTSGAGGNLWYEEQLPSETVLYSLALASRPRRAANGLTTADDVLRTVEELRLPRLQVGGDETVGRGIVAVRFARGQVPTGGAA